jgi:hypothetical protein
MPPSISRAGAGACTTVPVHDQFRTFGHDHPELRGDHVKTFRGVLADHRHARPAARARGVLRRQRHLDPRQVCRQGATAGTPPVGIVAAQPGIALLRLGIAFGNRLLQSLETQLQLVLGQTLGAGAELRVSRCRLE